MAFSDYGPTNTTNRQLTNYKPTPQYKFLSNEQQRCIGQMLSFFKRNKEVIYKLRIKGTGDTIGISGENIREWLDGILSEGQYFSSQSHMLNTMRGCWLENKGKNPSPD
jgi:hypothetical protein